MQYKLIKYNSILNKITSKDRLFSGDYTIDPYQNCEFGCKYCDSIYEDVVYIKSNAVELLEKELDDNSKGTIIVGSVHDPYQKAEEEYNTTRKVLKVIKKHNFSCHILTKSDLILRDLDILSKIDNCTVTISITSLNTDISKIFEKKVSSPIKRLETIKKLSEMGIKSGLAIMPVLPFISERSFEEIIKSASNSKAQYVLYKHLELKGDQKNYFIKSLEEIYPNLVKKYEELYKDSYMPDEEYIKNLNYEISELSKKYKIKNRI